MRNLPVKLILSLTPFLLASGSAIAQAQSAADQKAPPTTTTTTGKEPPPKPKPSELEQKLAEALVNNPDICVAEAKLREAEAELNRVRFQVLQKVSTLHHAVEAQKAVIQAAENGPGTLSITLFTQEKAKLAAIEAELPAVLGRPPRSASADRIGADNGETAPTEGFFRLSLVPGTFLNRYQRDKEAWAQPASTSVELTGGAMADKIRHALDTPVTLDIQDKSLSEALKDIHLRTPGILFHTVLPGEQMARMKVSLEVENLPLGAALQALEDSFPEMRAQEFSGNRGLRFAVREYGILITTQGSLPPGAMLLHDFWKGRPVKEKASGSSAPDHDGGKSRPPDNIEGGIKATDPQSGMVTLNIGSDAGLREGHTLEVYRLKPKPTYVGTIQIVDLRPTEAVAKPTSGVRGVIEVGDRVTSSIRRR